MSDTSPTIRVGDRVRVMQTARSEEYGVANCKGIVEALHRHMLDSETSAEVMLDGWTFTFHIPLSALAPAPLEIER